MAALTKIVQRAVNFDPDRGDQIDVVNIPFEKGPQAEGVAAVPWWKQADAYKPVVPGVLILLFLLFVARPMVRWMTRSPAVDTQLLRQLPMTVGEMERGVGGQKQLPLSDELNRTVGQNKEQAVQFLREWIKEQR